MDTLRLLLTGALLPTLEIAQRAPLGGVSASTGTFLPFGTFLTHSSSTAVFSSILWLVAFWHVPPPFWILWAYLSLSQLLLCLCLSLLHAQLWVDPEPFGLSRKALKGPALGDRLIFVGRRNFGFLLPRRPHLHGACVFCTCFGCRSFSRAFGYCKVRLAFGGHFG